MTPREQATHWDRYPDCTEWGVVAVLWAAVAASGLDRLAPKWT
ncbi:hypothetical protein [Micromonospora aurantiaca (nom. illeg.)]